MVKGNESRDRKGGRPTRSQAEARGRKLVEAAAALFTERGFDATSMDAVAEAAGVSKATLYSHYNDKAEMFAAVLRRQIDHLFDDLDRLNAGPGSAEEILLSLGRLAIEMASRLETVSMYRIIIAQSHRFPALGEIMDREGFQRGRLNISNVLRHLAARGEIELDDAELMAELFLSLVIGRLSRMALLGLKIEPEKMEDSLRGAIRLFLQGTSAKTSQP